VKHHTRFAAAGAVGVVLLALLVVLLVPRDFYTGTNSVRVRSYLFELERTSSMCIPQVRVPGGTGRVEFKVNTNGKPQPPLDFTLELDGTTHRDSLPAGPGGVHKIQFTVPETPEEPAERTGQICVASGDGASVYFGGVPGLIQGDVGIELGGRTYDGRVAMWFLPPKGEQASVLSQLPEIFRREAMFKPGWVGTWTYWLLLFGLAPAILGLGLWVLLTAERRRRLPLLVGLLVFANAAVWAHVTPAFQAPDESEHYAYVESLSERHEPLASVTLDDPPDPYSGHQTVALESARVFSTNEAMDGRPPWLPVYEQQYHDRVAAEQPRRDDGGGFAVAASPHSPLYYALLVPGYRVAKGDVFDELVAMRLISALLGGIVGLCAVLLVMELLPGRRTMAAAAGLLAGFQPMFAFMSGAVNNDMGVNAAAAVVLLLLIRTLRRGFGLWQSVGLGAALVLMPLAKGTGYALYPAALLALGLAAWRWRDSWRAQWRGAAGLVASFAAVYLTWILVSGSLDRSTFTTPGGQVPGKGFGALSHPFDALAYLWQVFLPKLPFMTDHWSQSWPALEIYAKRGWGAFGWYAITWPEGLYKLIMAGMILIAVMGLATLWRRRDWTRSHVPEILVLLTAIAGVVTAVHFAYYTDTTHADSFPEQGRYLFPVITALATMGVGATYVLGRRAQSAAVALASGVMAFGYASMWLVVAGFYFLVLT
jgi:hypothetical protein